MVATVSKKLLNLKIKIKDELSKALKMTDDSVPSQPIYDLFLDVDPFCDYVLKLQMNFDGYPTTAPSFKILTLVFHPNVNVNGELCLTELGKDEYFPGLDMILVINNILSILNSPSEAGAFDSPPTDVFRKSPEEWKIQAREHLKKNGTPR